eukprot:6211219-Pleurochrysis_carterae.AAC.4
MAINRRTNRHRHTYLVNVLLRLLVARKTCAFSTQVKAPPHLKGEAKIKPPPGRFYKDRAPSG